MAERFFVTLRRGPGIARMPVIPYLPSDLIPPAIVASARRSLPPFHRWWAGPLAALAMVAALATEVMAAESSWRGTLFDDWYSAANWIGGVPVSSLPGTHDIVIANHDPFSFGSGAILTPELGFIGSLYLQFFNRLELGPNNAFVVHSLASPVSMWVSFRETAFLARTLDDPRRPALSVSSDTELARADLGDLANFSTFLGRGTLTGVDIEIKNGIVKFNQVDAFDNPVPLTTLADSSLTLTFGANFNAVAWQDSLPLLDELRDGSDLILRGRDYTFAGDVQITGNSGVRIEGGVVTIPGRINGSINSLPAGSSYELLRSFDPLFPSSTLVVHDALFRQNNAVVELAGPTSQITDQHGNNALRSLVGNSGILWLREGHDLSLSGDLANSGQLMATESLLAVAGDLVNSGDLYVAGGRVVVEGRLTNSAGGRIQVQESLMTATAGVLHVGAAPPALDGGFTLSAPPPDLINHGALIGTGTIIGDVESDGLIDVVGIFGLHRLDLAVEGKVNLLADGVVRLYLGLESGAEASTSLFVSGDLTLGGDLEILFNSITTVDPLLRFTILSGGTLAGSFDNVAFGQQLEVFHEYTGASLGFFDVLQESNNVVLANFVPELTSLLLLTIGTLYCASRRPRRQDRDPDAEIAHLQAAFRKK